MLNLYIKKNSEVNFIQLLFLKFLINYYIKNNITFESKTFHLLKYHLAIPKIIAYTHKYF